MTSQSLERYFDELIGNEREKDASCRQTSKQDEFQGKARIIQ
jgi:hypothetical protein